MLPTILVSGNNSVSIPVEYEATRIMYELCSKDAIISILSDVGVNNPEQWSRIDRHSIGPDLQALAQLRKEHPEFYRHLSPTNENLNDQALAQHIGQDAKLRSIGLHGLVYDVQRKKTSTLLYKLTFGVLILFTALSSFSFIPAAATNIVFNLFWVMLTAWALISAWPSNRNRLSQPFEFIISRNYSKELFEMSQWTKICIGTPQMIPSPHAVGNPIQHSETSDAKQLIKLVMYLSCLFYEHEDGIDSKVANALILQFNQNRPYGEGTQESNHRMCHKIKSMAKLSLERKIEPMQIITLLSFILTPLDQLYTLIFPNPIINTQFSSTIQSDDLLVSTADPKKPVQTDDGVNNEELKVAEQNPAT